MIVPERGESEAGETSTIQMGTVSYEWLLEPQNSKIGAGITHEQPIWSLPGSFQYNSTSFINAIARCCWLALINSRFITATTSSNLRLLSQPLLDPSQ